MKRIGKFIFIFILFCLLITPVKAKEHDITLYFFHGDGCPHCLEEEKYLQTLKGKVKIIDYEVWYNTENEELMNKVLKAYKINKSGVPLTVIGNTYFMGYSDNISKSIDRAIDYYQNNEYVDQINKIKNGENIKITDRFSKMEKKSEKKFYIKVPFIGKVNVEKLSITSAAAIIGLIDGFNPCAMWVLLFLISILLGLKDKKRMWVLGLTFLITSALVYTIIMFSWLNIVVKVSTSIFIRNIIGILAIIGGVYNLISFFKSKDSGCSVVDNKKRKKIFASIKKITHEKNYILAIIGIMILAISVNLVELACSAGLPLVFTQLLAINKVSSIAGFYYTLIYILFFLLDDLIVFFVAMFTMNMTGISTKYNKYSHLIGGIIMLIIGLLLIFNYKLLTFSF